MLPVQIKLGNFSQTITGPEFTVVMILSTDWRC